MKISLWSSIVLSLLISVPAGAAQKINYAGTQHPFYDFYNIILPGVDESLRWYLPAHNLRPTLGLYHLDPNKVKSHIQGIRNSGSTAYALNIWHTPIGRCELSACNDGVVDGVWGEVVDNSTGALLPQHESNLRAIVGEVIDQGFEKMYIRFAYNSNPKDWTVWEETLYQEAWNFIVDVRAVAREVVIQKNLGHKLNFPHSFLMFDLGGEDAGLFYKADGSPNGQMRPFIKRLWTNYTASFGVDDTFGFSFAWSDTAPTSWLTQQIALYEEVGVVPRYWAFDPYDGVKDSLTRAFDHLGKYRNQPLVVLETFFHDAAVLADISEALDDYEFLLLDAVVQWPVKDNGDVHISESVLDALDDREMLFQSDNPSLIKTSDVNCNATTTWPCSVKLEWSNVTAGSAIYVETPNGYGAIDCYPPAAKQIQLDWISVYPFYKFHVYQGGCASLPSSNPSLITGTAEVLPFYASLRGERKLYLSSDNADLLKVRDINCAATTAWPCSIELEWTNLSSGHAIYVETSNGYGVIDCIPPQSKRLQIDWISVYPSYKFHVYQGACTPTPSGVLKATVDVIPYN